MADSAESDPEFRPTIEVEADWVSTAIKHGMDLYWSDSTPKKRLDRRGGADASDFSRYVNARVEGKMAEVAFRRFLEQYFDIQGRVDWRIYGDYDQTDPGDLHYLLDDRGNEVPPATEFDVKKTKSWNSWLALRTEMFERHPEDAPYILCTMDLEEDIDLREYEGWGEFPSYDYKFSQQLREYQDEHFPLEVTLEGTAYPEEFTHEFEQGDALHDPNDPDREFNMSLRMDNRAIPIQDLDARPKRWNRVVSEIVGDHDITWSRLDNEVCN